MTKPVNSKYDFYQRFKKGEFGNSSLHWDTYKGYLASGYPDLIAIRTRIPGGRCDYFISKNQVANRINDFKRDGYDLIDLHFSAQCPEEDKLLQGELMLTTRGLFLLGSTNLKLAMRQALKEDSFKLFGLAAHLFVKNRMCPNSWDWLQQLFDLYPGHVIEFTTLRYCWGDIPGFNTLFWEVRNY